MQIRKATVADIPAIQELAKASWWETYSPFIPREQIEYMLADWYSPATLEEQLTLREFLLVESGGQMAAFAAFSMKDGDPGVYKLQRLYAHPAFKGKGIGKLLMEKALEAAKAANAHAIELNVNRQNPAYHFYLRMGFSVHREEDLTVGPYIINDYVMRKPL